jgi:hypothetical protein
MSTVIGLLEGRDPSRVGAEKRRSGGFDSEERSVEG